MSIAFVKGVPTFVHPKMHKDVMEKGVLPVDENNQPVDPTSHTAGLEAEPKIRLAPEDGYDRGLKILEVIKAIVARNNPKDFTAAGMPSARAISTALGWTVDHKEVKGVWEEHRREVLHGKE
jgi:hypothetical protein